MEEKHLILLQRNGQEAPKKYSVEEFTKITGVTYLEKCEYASDKILKRIRSQCSKTKKNYLIDVKKEWLGSFYAKELKSFFVANIFIKWIDAEIGYGVFANTSFEPFEFVAEYTGEIKKYNSLFYKDTSYVFSYPTSGVCFFKHVIDSKYKGNESRYINHKDTPNCEILSVFLDGFFRVIIRTLKPIQAGEELLINYGKRYWQSRTPRGSKIV